MGGGSRVIAGIEAWDEDDSVGEDAELVIEGGADDLFRRWEMVPSVGEELINGG